MKKTISLLIALLVFPALTASAALLEGTVQKIDQAKKQIVLNTETGQETLDISSATKGAEKVKTGDKVKVTYTKKGEKLVADSIDASKSGSPASPTDMPPASRGRGEKSPMGAN